MSFRVQIDQFVGPLDLMLHLIREQQMSIFDFDIDVLTDQYLAYINEMEDLQLEIESEYLVELATLIEYKSKKLLPKEETILDGEYEADPKERLIQRLLEYQQYKEITEQLSDFYHQRNLQMAKPISMEVDHWIKKDDSTLPIDGNAYDLVKAMYKVLRRMKLSKPIETKFTQKEISVDDRILQLKARLKDLDETFTFETLLEDCNENLHLAIVTFLAVLDLSRLQILTFFVDSNETIWFKRG
ncbi:chromosome segregation protein ScpA [Erysipelotrichaceae bacterium OH741_COT-311]|nr:chromosome segregation protein ScpA [Erysipelotrichaceae bacterium OH741_COT-311]